MSKYKESGEAKGGSAKIRGGETAATEKKDGGSRSTESIGSGHIPELGLISKSRITEGPDNLGMSVNGPSEKPQGICKDSAKGGYSFR